MVYPKKEKYEIGDLLEIVRILRAPGGCPWDREQTHTSMRKNLIEETYEVADAIDLADADMLCEELGDLLLQIAMHAEIEKEDGVFSFSDVCDGICKKLIFRHPHVFGEVSAETTGQVLNNWEALKSEEKGIDSMSQQIDSVPKSFPAVMRAAKVQKRVARYGFCYPNAQAAIKDMESELAELKQAMNTDTNIEEEVGDVLFSAVNVARMLDIDAEEALSKSTQKFITRIKTVETLANDNGKDLISVDANELDDLWKKAKSSEAEK